MIKITKLKSLWVIVLLCMCLHPSLFGQVDQVKDSISAVTKDELAKHSSKFADWKEKHWDAHNKKKKGKQKKEKHKSKHRRHDDYKVMGWHTYSNGSSYAYYDFELLWAIAYFSYEVDPESGSYKTIHSWRETNLVDTAHKSDCKVLLTITNFGADNNHVFLKNEDAQQTCIDSVISLLELKGADGVNIDFESVNGRNRDEFSKFIIKLSEGLKKHNRKYIVTIDLYAYDPHKVFEIDKIDKHIDVYNLMAYDYFGGFSKVAGPVSPLYPSKLWGDLCVSNSVDHYLKEGVDAKKLIVCYPYYGAKWSVKSEKVHSKVKKFYGYLPYYKIKEHIIDNPDDKTFLDTLADTKYFSFKADDGTDLQIWFDDSLTIATKCDYILGKELGGVGVWTLGYEGNHNELWNLLEVKFSKHPHHIGDKKENENKVAHHKEKKEKHAHGIHPIAKELLWIDGILVSILLLTLALSLRICRLMNLIRRFERYIWILGAILGAIGFVLVYIIDDFHKFSEETLIVLILVFAAFIIQRILRQWAKDKYPS